MTIDDIKEKFAVIDEEKHDIYKLIEEEKLEFDIILSILKTKGDSEFFRNEFEKVSKSLSDNRKQIGILIRKKIDILNEYLLERKKLFQSI